MARKIKNISLNVETDADVIEFIDSLPNFSDWVKKQVRARQQEKSFKDMISELFKDKDFVRKEEVIEVNDRFF